MLDANLVTNRRVLEAIRLDLPLALDDEVIHSGGDVQSVRTQLRLAAVSVHAPGVLILLALLDNLTVGSRTLHETPVSIRYRGACQVFAVDFVGGLLPQSNALFVNQLQCNAHRSHPPARNSAIKCLVISSLRPFRESIIRLISALSFLYPKNARRLLRASINKNTLFLLKFNST